MGKGMPPTIVAMTTPVSSPLGCPQPPTSAFPWTDAPLPTTCGPPRNHASNRTSAPAYDTTRMGGEYVGRRPTGQRPMNPTPADPLHVNHGDSAVAPPDFWRERRSQHPHFCAAVIADARCTMAYRGEGGQFRSRRHAATQCLRLLLVSDAFFAQVCYRAKARMQSLRVPFLPRVAHWLAMTSAQVSIGNPVVIAPGLYLLHGQVVIDGITTIGPNVRIAPFVTIGLRSGDFAGPTISANVEIGSGAKVLGTVRVGTGARIGANAVVLTDVPARTTAIGVPARIHQGPSSA